jgi:hypothetical protein
VQRRTSAHARRCENRERPASRWLRQRSGVDRHLEASDQESRPTLHPRTQSHMHPCLRLAVVPEFGGTGTPAEAADELMDQQMVRIVRECGCGCRGGFGRGGGGSSHDGTVSTRRSCAPTLDALSLCPQTLSPNACIAGRRRLTTPCGRWSRSSCCSTSCCSTSCCSISCWPTSSSRHSSQGSSSTAACCWSGRPNRRWWPCGS